MSRGKPGRFPTGVGGSPGQIHESTWKGNRKKQKKEKKKLLISGTTTLHSGQFLD